MSDTYYKTPQDSNVRNSTGLSDRAGAETTHVTEVAKGQAGKVAGEAGRQARNLMDQARSEATDQAAQQQERVASGLRKVSGQLKSMGDNAEEGMAGNLVREVAQRTDSLAEWLDARDPGSVLEEVKSFARRRPGAFMAIAAVAGVAVGRLTRSVMANVSESSDTRVGEMPARTAPPPYVAPAAPGLDTEFTGTNEYSDIRDVTP
jgi:uncharacterized protein YjbJ (UPF0337 family)